MKTLKNIRKLHNAKVLLLGNNESVKLSISKEFDEYFKELRFSTDISEALMLLSESNYDIIIIDTNVEGTSFEETCVQITQTAPSLPKIIVTNDDNNANIVTAIGNSAYAILSKPLKSQDVRLAIIMSLNQTKRGDKIEFQNGLYFDEYRDQFFKAGGSIIEFTKLEKGFLKLLIAKRGDTIDYETIKSVVWKGKNMSIYTMRNIVNKIRLKTYYEIIKNNSNRGYTIEEPQ